VSPNGAELQVHTRQQLLDAAAEVLGERGFSDATLREIANRAGLSSGAIYSNFTGKDDLVLAIIEQRFARLLGSLDAALSAEAPLHTRASNAGLDFFAYLQAERNWSRVYHEFRAHTLREHETGARFGRLYEQLAKRIGQLAERRLHDAGIASPAPANTLGHVVLAIANGLSLERLTHPGAVPDATAGLLLAALVRGLAVLTVDEEADQR